MRMRLLYLSLSIWVLGVFPAGAQESAPESPTTRSSVTAFFVSTEGHALAPASGVGESASLSAKIAGADIRFSVLQKDWQSDLVVLQPDQPLSVKPVTFFMGDPETGSGLTCFTYQLNEATGEQVPVSIEGAILSLTGIEGDIRHLTVQLPEDIHAQEGPVFSIQGLCQGFLSERVTDLYQLVRSQSEASNVFLAIKADAIFPLIKSLPGVAWVTDQEMKASTAQMEASVFSLNVELPDSVGSKGETEFEQLRGSIPQGVPFMVVDLAAGYDASGFAEMLLGALEKHNIGPSLPQSIKQDYYRSILKTYGQDGVSADELVKMAADLAGGYFLEASVSVAAGDVEDWVRIKVYEPNSITLKADIRVGAILSKSPEEVAALLTEKAVKELSQKMNDK